MEQKEQWIDNTLRSLEGAQRIKADPELYDKVMARVRQNNAPQRRLPLLGMAAAAALLLLFNVASILHFSGISQSTARQNVAQVINEDMSTLSEGSF